MKIIIITEPINAGEDFDMKGAAAAENAEAAGIFLTSFSWLWHGHTHCSRCQGRFAELLAARMWLV